MTLRERIGLLGLICWLAAGVYAQQTIYVNGTTGNDAWDGLCETWDGATCGPKATIQAGIDAAIDGDTALVADGTYTGTGNKNLDFHGKAITVRSANGPDNCIIDCQGSGQGFLFNSGETELAVIEGLTVMHGSGGDDPDYSYGGAIYCDASSPTITGCEFLQNSAFWGGAVCCYSGSNPTISGCAFIGNLAVVGGAIECYVYSSPVIADCVISGNSTTLIPDVWAGSGGGISCDEFSDATIVNCVITANTATFGGGGIACVDSSPTINNCAVRDNIATTYYWAQFGMGGGICCKATYYYPPPVPRPAIVNCTITDNCAVGAGWYHDGSGGGVYCGGQNVYATATITNCLIVGNSATNSYYAEQASGGGTYAEYGTTITNCTIVNNTTSGTGGGLWSGDDSVMVANCIVWGNTPGEVDGGDPTVTYCDVQGGWLGEGNIDADPKVAFGDDEHLMPGSPCIDMGTNEPPAGLPPDDLEGNPRPLDGNGDSVATADMGAFEFNPAVQTLALSPLLFSFDAVEGLSEVPEARLWIRNAGLGTLNWDITASCDWLVADPANGTAGIGIEEVTITAHPAGLSPGQYAGELTVEAAPAANSPRTVPVTLRVLHALH